MEFNLSYWILQTVAMLLTALLIPRLKVTNVFGAFLTVVALAFINSHLWSAALFFQIPDTISSKALVLVAANGLIFWIVVKILPGIEITGFLPALVAPIVFTLCNFGVGYAVQHVDWQYVWSEAQRFSSSAREQLSDVAPRPSGESADRSAPSHP